VGTAALGRGFDDAELEDWLTTAGIDFERPADVAEEVAKLKEQPGKNILKYGTGELDKTLVEHGLVDEFHFWYFPVVVGAGRHLFEGAGFDTTHLKLAEVNQFGSGIVVHVYVPK